MQHFASSSILSNSGMSCVQRSQVWEQGGERLARPLYSHLSYTSLCRRPPVTASSCCSLPEAGCGTFRSHPGLLHKTQHSLYNSSAGDSESSFQSDIIYFRHSTNHPGTYGVNPRRNTKQFIALAKNGSFFH